MPTAALSRNSPNDACHARLRHRADVRNVAVTDALWRFTAVSQLLSSCILHVSNPSISDLLNSVWVQSYSGDGIRLVFRRFLV